MGSDDEDDDEDVDEEESDSLKKRRKHVILGKYVNTGYRIYEKSVLKIEMYKSIMGHLSYIIKYHITTLIE